MRACYTPPSRFYSDTSSSPFLCRLLFFFCFLVFPVRRTALHYIGVERDIDIPPNFFFYGFSVYGVWRSKKKGWSRVICTG